jgi:hypothetical protein
MPHATLLCVISHSIVYGRAKSKSRQPTQQVASGDAFTVFPEAACLSLWQPTSMLFT